MRLLINGRETRGPGSAILAFLCGLILLAVVLFVMLPIVGIMLGIAAVTAAVYLVARTLRRGRSRATLEPNDDAEYHIESSRPLGARDRAGDSTDRPNELP